MVPNVVVEIDFANNPMWPSPTWTDVSQFVRAVSTRRGRQRELDRIEAGTATVVLDNRTGRFTPSNTASPYYPNVIPMRRIRISAYDPASNSTYRLFWGYIESWAQNWPEFGDATATLSCSDAFKIFTLFQISSLTRPQESTGARINAVLDAVGWPSSLRSVDAGQSQVQAQTIQNTAALQYLQTVAETENGMLFVGASGNIVFRNRHARIVPATNVPIFGDGPGELPYTSLTLEYTDDQIWNSVTVSRQGGVTPGQAQDTTSQAKFGTRSLSKQSTLQVSDAECQAAAEYLVGRYANPQLVIRSMDIEPQTSDALWPIVLSQELGARVIVRRRQPVLGPPPTNSIQVEQNSFIEGITWDIETNYWRAAWQLSSADIETFWVLAGSDTDQYAQFSRLEQSTRLAY